MFMAADFLSRMLLICVVLVTSWTALVSGSCESPWFQYDDSCFYVSPSAASDVVLTWRGAEDWCLQNGGHLATIESKEERVAISNVTQVGVYNGAMWIGLNRLNDQVNYEWIDGTASDFRNWALGQPVDGSVGMCVYQATHLPTTCFTTEEDVNMMITILDLPGSAQPDDTFSFWETFSLNDSAELPRCQKSCSDEPNCFYYTFVSYYSMNLQWDGSCTGANSNYNYSTVYDQYAYSGYRQDCPDIGLWYEANCGEKRGFICKRGVDDTETSIPTTAPTPSVPGFCPSGFIDAGGNKCFKFVIGSSMEGLTWNEAHQLCLAEKGIAPNLASIQSEYENAVITMYIRQHYWAFWIGIRQSESYSDQWVWSDNQEPQYFNWAEGKPAGYGQCGEMWTNPGPIGTWNNQDCSYGRGYICQTYKDENDIISTPGSTMAHSCKTDYINYGGICYRKITTASDWSAALVTCQADGATLATVHSPAENAALYVFAADIAPFWIGYHKNENSEWVWTDDWPSIYSNWNAGEDPGTGGGCASFKDSGKWKDDVCNSSLNFVCMISNAILPTTPVNVEGMCLDGWLEFGAHCYYFGNVSMTWTFAEQDCINRAGLFSHGNLASIHSVAENEFIYQTLKSKYIPEAWIGLHEVAPGDPHTWSDGSGVQYVRWAPGEPNDDETNAQQCCGMYVDMWPGMWNDHWCDNAYFKYVCKAPKVDQITTPTSPPGGQCPQSSNDQKPWIASGAFCYYYDSTNILDVNAAQEFCVRLAGRDAKLATIPDSYTNYLFFEMVQGTPNVGAWIGLTRPHINAEFRWMDEQDFNFTYWLKGEPNNMGDEHCVEMQIYQGFWNDMPCYYTRPFICQIKMEDVLPPTTQPPGPDSSVPMESGIFLTSGELAGIIIGTMLGTVLLIGLGLLIWYLVRGKFSTGKKEEDYNNFDSSFSRSSSTRSTPSRSDA